MHESVAVAEKQDALLLFAISREISRRADVRERVRVYARPMQRRWQESSQAKSMRMVPHALPLV